MERDDKWELMWASVGHHRYDIDANTYIPPSHMIEFRIEVYYAGMFWWCAQTIHRRDLAEIDPRVNAYKFILDGLVERMDEYLSGKLGLKE